MIALTQFSFKAYFIYLLKAIALECEHVRFFYTTRNAKLWRFEEMTVGSGILSPSFSLSLFLIKNKDDKGVTYLYGGFGGTVLPPFQGRSTSFHLPPPSVWTGCVVCQTVKDGLFGQLLLERVQNSKGYEEKKIRK